MWLIYFGSSDPSFQIADPFSELQTLLAGQVGLVLLIPTIAAILFFVVLTVLLGNGFCSWACPIGTIIDSFDNGRREVLFKR
jgi:polyferredoxin